MATRPAKTASLDQRISQIASPSTYQAPPPDDEPTPDIRELDLPDVTIRQLSQLVLQSAEWGTVIKEATTARKPITEAIKKVLAEHQISKFNCDGVLVAFYSAERSSIKPKMLLAQGVPQDVIDAATEKTVSSTLRVGGGE